MLKSIWREVKTLCARVLQILLITNAISVVTVMGLAREGLIHGPAVAVGFANSSIWAEYSPKCYGLLSWAFHCSMAHAIGNLSSLAIIMLMMKYSGWGFIKTTLATCGISAVSELLGKFMYPPKIQALGISGGLYGIALVAAYVVANAMINRKKDAGISYIIMICINIAAVYKAACLYRIGVQWTVIGGIKMLSNEYGHANGLTVGITIIAYMAIMGIKKHNAEKEAATVEA